MYLIKILCQSLRNFYLLRKEYLGSVAQGEAPKVLGADGLDDHTVHGDVADGSEVDELDAKRQELELVGAGTHRQHLVAKGLCVCQHEVAAVGLRVWVDEEQGVPWDAVEPEVGDHVAAQRDEEGVLREAVGARVSPARPVLVKKCGDGRAVLEGDHGVVADRLCVCGGAGDLA